MEPLNKNLDKLEAHLRFLFEDKLFSIFNVEGHSRSLFSDLIHVMEQNIITNDAGLSFAPDRYIISVPRQDFIKWQIHQDILDEIAAVIYTKGRGEGFLFRHKPIIQLKSDLLDQSIQLKAEISPINSLKFDTDVITQEEHLKIEDTLPEEAFLIVGGMTNFPLKGSVINIGRHSENDLIINDPHISRHHAQLRAIKKRYIIFDVGSIGGTLINGKPITQATLFNGDVIRLGMTNLIYVQTDKSTKSTTAIPTNDDESPL